MNRADMNALITNKQDSVYLRRSKNQCRKKLTGTHVCMLLHTTSEILHVLVAQT